MDVHGELKQSSRGAAKNAGADAPVRRKHRPQVSAASALPTRGGGRLAAKRTETGLSTVVDVPQSSYKSKLKS